MVVNYVKIFHIVQGIEIMFITLDDKYINLDNVAFFSIVENSPDETTINFLGGNSININYSYERVIREVEFILSVKWMGVVHT